MKLILTLLLTFLFQIFFGQTVVVKEYDHETATFGDAITTKTVVPGDTITFSISILESSKNDFIISPHGGGGAEQYRGLKIITPDNTQVIPIIGTYKEKAYDIEFLADSNILAIHDSSIANPGASGSFSLTGKFVVDSLNHFDSIAFKYVHIVIPCELEPGNYFITLDEVDDFIANEDFSSTNILELVYDEPEVTIDIPAPDSRTTCYTTDVNLDVNIEGGSDCAAYKLFVNNEDKGQYGDTITYDFSYGDWVKVQILGGVNFSDSILIDTSYFQPNPHLSNSPKGENRYPTSSATFKQTKLLLNQINICTVAQSEPFPLLQERARVRCV